MIVRGMLTHETVCSPSPAMASCAAREVKLCGRYESSHSPVTALTAPRLLRSVTSAGLTRYSKLTDTGNLDQAVNGVTSQPQAAIISVSSNVFPESLLVSFRQRRIRFGHDLLDTDLCGLSNNAW